MHAPCMRAGPISPDTFISRNNSPAGRHLEQVRLRVEQDQEERARAKGIAGHGHRAVGEEEGEEEEAV